MNVRTPYFDSLIDDFGIWQHSDGTHILRGEGYALDDATRGLVLCLALGRTGQARVLFNYLLQSRKDSDFYGFYNDSRKPIQFPASDDAKGQVIWAMGYAVHKKFEAPAARQLIANVAPSLSAMQSLRGPAYSLLGAVYADKSLAAKLKDTVAGRFAEASDGWFWPEGQLTYANGLMPYALLRYALLFHDKQAAELGRKALEFVERCCTLGGRIRGPIGYDGWFKRGDPHPADDGQQAIDAAYMIWAWIAAYQLSGSEYDLRRARAWMQWFDGSNIAHKRMYDPETMKAYDGINLHATDHHTPDGVNYHSGAESNICLLLSRYVMDTKTTV